MTELAAAIGLVQLARLDDMLRERRALAERYQDALADLSPQRIPEGARCNHQTFGVVLPERMHRDVVIGALRERGIESGRLSYALHTLPQFAAYGGGGAYPVANMLAERGLALPLWAGLAEADQVKVIEAVQSVLAC